jgi:hypothetical protein
LPAGEYELAKWSSYSWSEYVPIAVQARRITDLGSLIPFSIGDDQFVVLPLRPREYASRVQDAVTELRPVLSSIDPIQWSPQTPPKPFTVISPPTRLGLIADLLVDYSHKLNRPPLKAQLSEARSIADFFALAKQYMPPRADTPATDGHGNLYFGADVGQIRVRNARGEWAALDTGSIGAITAVYATDGRILAGNRSGAVLASADSGQSWAAMATLPPEEAVVDIRRLAGHWLIVSMRPTLVFDGVASFDNLKVYRSDADDLGGLHVIKELKLDPKKLLMNWHGVDVQVDAGKYFVNVYSDLLQLDVATMEWGRLTPVADVSGFSVSPNGNVYAAYHGAGIFSSFLLSTDRGQTWKKIAAPPYNVLYLYFDDDGNGHAVRRKLHALSSELDSFAYDNATQQWTLQNKAPDGCVSLLHDENHQPAFCLSRGGSILKNTGTGWAVEFAGE